MQVWIDGAPQFDKPTQLRKPITRPLTPNTQLSNDYKREEAQNLIFTGIKKLLTTQEDLSRGSQGTYNVVVTDGTVSCIGDCKEELQIAAGKAIVIDLKNGYFSPAFTAFGSSLGLLEIDAVKDTQDGGYSADSFSRAIDGLALDGKQLQQAYNHGVTRAISAPSRGSILSKGISVGFSTGALSTLEKGAVWQEDVALHYPLTSDAKSPSTSAAIGKLRDKLLKATNLNTTAEAGGNEPSSEENYLRQVVIGKLPLVLSVHKADTIAAIIRVKAEVGKAIAKASQSSSLRIILFGAAESHLVAHEIARANISVVLAPLLPYAQSWDQRRSLTGAPLTNGTTIDALLDAKVLVAISVAETWETRNLRLLAAWAYKNGEGRLDEHEAFDLVGANIYRMLGINIPKHREDWLIWEGDPLEIGAQLRGQGGQGKSAVWR